MSSIQDQQARGDESDKAGRMTFDAALAGFRRATDDAGRKKFVPGIISYAGVGQRLDDLAGPDAATIRALRAKPKDDE